LSSRRRSMTNLRKHARGHWRLSLAGCLGLREYPAPLALKRGATRRSLDPRTR
jgi:hypothetical protein